MKKKKYIKYAIIILICVVFVVMCFFIYKNLFASTNSTRIENKENYKLTNNEINSVKDVFKDVEQVKNIKVYQNYKIIKIFISLSEDVDIENIKLLANQSLAKFSKENLEYYDIEIFVESKNEESEFYPIIGYKYQSSSEFSW